MTFSEKPELFCAFCLRPRSETGTLAGSPLAAICHECARQAATLHDAHTPTPSDDTPMPVHQRWTDDELLGNLPQIATARDSLEECLHIWVDEARRRNISWARIGDAMNMTRQSAWERFHKPTP